MKHEDIDHTGLPGVGGAGATVSENFLTADVTMTTAGTEYTGPALTLAAGTYLLFGRIIVNIPSGATNVAVRLTDGTSTYDSGEHIYSAGGQVETTVIGTVVLGGSTTVSVRAKAGVAAATIKATGGQYGITNKGSHLMAVRIA